MKFQIGDKVRRVNNSYHNQNIGDIGVVNEISSIGSISFEGDTSFYDDDDDDDDDDDELVIPESKIIQRVSIKGYPRYMMMWDDVG